MRRGNRSARYFWLFGVFGLWSCAHAGGPVVPGQNAVIRAQRALTDMEGQLSSGHVSAVRVFHVPLDNAVIAALTPQELEARSTERRGVAPRRYSGDPSTDVVQSLLHAMRDTQIAAGTDGPRDLRYGLVLYGAKNKRLGAVYLAGWGDSASVGGSTVSLKGGLRRWMGDHTRGW